MRNYFRYCCFAILFPRCPISASSNPLLSVFRSLVAEFPVPISANGLHVRFGISQNFVTMRSILSRCVESKDQRIQLMIEVYLVNFHSLLSFCFVLNFELNKFYYDYVGIACHVMVFMTFYGISNLRQKTVDSDRSRNAHVSHAFIHVS